MTRTGDPADTKSERRRLARQDDYPRAVLRVVIGATFVTVLDSSLVSTALERIGRDLHATDSTHWVVTAYLLSASIAMTCGPWLSDRLGRRRAFLLGLVLFTVGALGSASAPSAAVLFGTRALQGVATGVIVPVGMALIFEVHTGVARTRALATWGLAAVIAPTAGPFVGGLLTSSLGWRPLFLLEAPIALGSVLVSYRLLIDDGVRLPRRLDLAGLIYGGGGLAAVLLALSEASTGEWAPGVVALISGTGALLLGLFVHRSLRAKAPLLRVRVLGERSFGITMLVVCLLSAAQYARLVLVPIAVEAEGGSPRSAGLVVGAMALGTAPAMLWAGRAVTRFGSARVVVAGGALATASSVPLCLISHPSSLASLACMLVLGAALGLSIVPATVAGLDGLAPGLLSDAAAWRGLSRQLSGAIGVSVVSAIFIWRAGSLGISSTSPAFHAAYQDCCILLLVLPTLAFLAACTLRTHRP